MPNHHFQPKSLEEILAPEPRQSKPATKKVRWRGRPGEPTPLWAVLGEDPPFDWQPPAPEPVRQPVPSYLGDGGELTVTGHPAFGFGPTHTALQYNPPVGPTEWISAASDIWPGQLVSGAGFDDDPNEIRASDRPDQNTHVGQITPPPGMNAAEYWDMLKSLDARYSDNVDYDLFPELQDSYNSNSYTSGLLNISGGTSTVPFGNLVGGASPLPADYFAPPHLRGTDYPNSLNPQAPPIFRRKP